LLFRLFFDLGAQAFFLLAQFRRELGAEIVRFEDLADLDFGLFVVRIRAALEPLDRFLARTNLPEPEAGDQLLGLGKRAVDDGALVSRETYPHALRAGMKAFSCKHDAGLHEFLVVLAHRGEQFLAWHLAGFRGLAGFHYHHELHGLLLRLVDWTSAGSS